MWKREEQVFTPWQTCCVCQNSSYCFERIYASHYPPSIPFPSTKHASKYPLTTPELKHFLSLPSIPLHYFSYPLYLFSSRKQA